MRTQLLPSAGLLLSLGGASVLALLVVPTIVRQVNQQHTQLQVQLASQQLAPGGDADILERYSNATRQIARRMRPSVVHISASKPVGEGRRGHAMVGSGSGWIWDASGNIVTNNHVVEGAARIDVQLHDGAVHSAEVVGSDPLTDIAVLRIDAGTQIGAARHSNFSDVEQGDLVFAFGSPLDFRFSMSSGLVSGMGRSAGIMGTRRRAGYEDFIQVDAAINPGNSGGPLTDARGRVIGMNTAIATDVQNPDGTGRFSGIGLAIPLPMIESVVQQLLDTGEVRKGFLGISVVEPSNALRELGGRDAPAGVVVTGPAFKGIAQGDVILRCDDTRVFTEGVLQTACQEDDDGVVSLEVWNLVTLKTRRVNVTLPDTWPVEDLLVDANTPFHEFIAMHDGPVGGVVVTWCQQDSPAERCGLVAGDVILRIQGRDIRTVEQLRSSISSVAPGQPITLETWRWTDPDRTSRRSAMLTDHPRADR